jgi:hypothetical protein
VATRSDDSPRRAVTLRYDGNDAVVTPVANGWRVEYDGRLVEDRYLESAIGKAVGIDPNEAISLATRLLDDHLDHFTAGEDGASGHSCQAWSEPGANRAAVTRLAVFAVLSPSQQRWR